MKFPYPQKNIFFIMKMIYVNIKGLRFYLKDILVKKIPQ